jgi:hypothetical protein
VYHDKPIIQAHKLYITVQIIHNIDKLISLSYNNCRIKCNNDINSNVIILVIWNNLKQQKKQQQQLWKF